MTPSLRLPALGRAVHRIAAPMAGLALLALASAPASAQVAGGVYAQPFGAANAFELDDLRARQDAAERRATLQANELMALEARLRAEQAVGSLTLQQRLPLTAPAADYPSPAAVAAAASAYPSVPDAALADSNRRVRDASRPRR